ncbi:MAG: sigma-54 dependent transcriptional regulator [Verrucomicrobiota bacterium]
MQNLALAGLSILVVEDEPLLRKQVAAYLERLGADLTSADSVQRARKLVQDLGFDFVLLDVNLPDGSGLDLLKDKAIAGNTGVVVMTAEGGVAGAVEAMRLGALDYLVKPFDLGQLPLVINRARRSKQSERIDEHRRSDATQTWDTFFFGAALGSLQTQLEKILGADSRLQNALPPVLIEGETGTGKTTIARWIHHRGPRAGQPLVEVNCSAMVETLAESELFGHERGAFTDARTARMGLFEAANGGTLFMDELPSLSLPLQAKVLTAIEDHKIRRLGGNKEIPIDVRIIAATNQHLKTLVSKGQFREDLYHRLDLFRVSIPPLRQRGDDILRLAERLLERLSRKHRLPAKTLHPDGRKRLLAYPWPGNVRELAHELERALVFEEGDELHFEPLSSASHGTSPSVATEHGDWFNERFVFTGEGTFALEEAINRLIHHALRQTHNNVSAAARLLGVSRDYVRYRLSGQKNGPPTGEMPQEADQAQA